MNEFDEFFIQGIWAKVVAFLAVVGLLVTLLFRFIMKNANKKSYPKAYSTSKSPEVENLRVNTNYIYTRKLTNLLDVIFKVLSLLFLIVGVMSVIAGIWEAHSDYGKPEIYVLSSLFCLFFSAVLFTVGKLLWEITNMMTDVADSNIKLVTQFSELISLQRQEVTTEDSKNLKPD